MIDVQVELQGVDEVIDRLRRLPTAFAFRGMRRALRRGARIVMIAAKNNARRIDDPITRERIFENIDIANGGKRRERQEGGPVVRVGVRGGARPLKKGTKVALPGGNTTHWRFVEFGTSEARAQPFLRPSLANNVQIISDLIMKAASEELDREIRKDNRQKSR